MSDIANSTQIRLERRSPSYWRVTFDHPPLNIFGPETIPRLNEIITALETDERVKVVVFDSAVEGFFLTHYNFLAKPEDSKSLPPSPTGLQPLPDMLARLSRARSSLSSQSAAALQGSEASFRSPAICVLPVVKKLSCRNGRLAPGWFQAAGQWRGYPALSAEDGRWKCCLGQTIFEAISPSFMVTSIELCQTRNSTLLLMRLRCGSPHLTNRPSRIRNIWWTLQACRLIRKLRLSGMHSSPLLGARRARRE